jgi:type IV pilus assembly protein PilA
MQLTSTQKNSKTRRHDFVELSRYINNSKGFTLVELLISIAIIGILAAVGIPQYTQYKVRAYDAHSKQALKDMHLLCNAYWLDTDSEKGCDLPIIKDATYGFNQNTDVVATLPPSPLDNFCASAKHNSSPNTYSIDSAALISMKACVAEPNHPTIYRQFSGVCPPGWTKDGLYWCLAEPNAPPIVQKHYNFPCPPEWPQYGNSHYCVGGHNAPSIVMKGTGTTADYGGCPPGWTKTGKVHCVAEPNPPTIYRQFSGVCPPGWTKDGLYWCLAEPNAPPIVQKHYNFPCPPEWPQYGNSHYCVGRPNAPSIVMKGTGTTADYGGCPLGWTKTGKVHCVEDE